MFKKLLSFLLITLSVLMFVIAFYIILFGTIAKNNNNNNVLYVFKYSYASVATSSMDAGDFGDDFAIKSFPKGTIILIKKTHYQDLKTTDVVVFKSKEDDKLIVHRLYIDDELNYKTKGDNNPDYDSDPFDNNSYQGKVVKIFNASGFSDIFVSSQGFILMAMVFILIAVVFYNLYQVFKILLLKKEEKVKKAFDKEAFLASVREEFYNEIAKKDK